MPRPRAPSPFSPGFQSAIAATFSITARARGSFMCASRNATGSAPAGARQLVHEGLRREHVGVGAERAQRRHAHRHVLDEVMHDLLVRETRRAGSRCGRRRRPAAAARSAAPAAAARPGTRRRARWRRVVAAAASMRVAPHVVVPVDDAAFGVERGLRLHRHRGAVRLPGELVVAHPLHPHRLARHRARQQRRVERDVVGAVVAVAAGAFDVDAADRAPAASSAPSPARRAAGTRPAYGSRPSSAVLEFRDRADGPIEACAR